MSRQRRRQPRLHRRRVRRPRDRPRRQRRSRRASRTRRCREISRLTWPTMSIPQIAHARSRIKGKPYLVEIDEYSQRADGDGVAGPRPRVGAARIIDIADETKPRVVSNMRLEVNKPENRAAIADDPGAHEPGRRATPATTAPCRAGSTRRSSPADHRSPACASSTSATRSTRREIAYFNEPPKPCSARSTSARNYAMSQPAFDAERTSDLVHRRQQRLLRRPADQRRVGGQEALERGALREPPALRHRPAARPAPRDRPRRWPAREGPARAAPALGRRSARQGAQDRGGAHQRAHERRPAPGAGPALPDVHQASAVAGLTNLSITPRVVRRSW